MIGIVVSDITNRFNALSNWVTTVILTTDPPKARVKVFCLPQRLPLKALDLLQDCEKALESVKLPPTFWQFPLNDGGHRGLTTRSLSTTQEDARGGAISLVTATKC